MFTTNSSHVIHGNTSFPFFHVLHRYSPSPFPHVLHGWGFNRSIIPLFPYPVRHLFFSPFNAGANVQALRRATKVLR